MAVSTDDAPDVQALEPDDGVPSAAQTYAFIVVLIGVFGVAALVVALLIGMNKSEGATSTCGERAGGCDAVRVQDRADDHRSATVGIHVTNNGNVQHNLADRRHVAGDADDRRRVSPRISTLSSPRPGDYTRLLPGSRPQRSGHDRRAARHRRRRDAQAAATARWRAWTSSSVVDDAGADGRRR